MSKPEFVRENGINYQIVNGEKIQRSHCFGNMEILLSEGMTMEEQVYYMVWNSENRK